MSGRGCSANASKNGASAGLGCVAGCSPRRSGGGGMPAAAYQAPRARYGLQRLAQKRHGGDAVLTELGIRRGGGARWSARWKRGGTGVDRQRFSTKIHAHSGAEGGEEGLGDDPGPTVMLLSDLSGTPVRRSCVAAAAGSLCYGGARQGGALGWVRLRQGEMGCGRGPGRV